MDIKIYIMRIEFICKIENDILNYIIKIINLIENV